MKIIPAAWKRYAFYLGLTLIFLWTASLKWEEKVPGFQAPVSPESASLQNTDNKQASSPHELKQQVPKATNLLWSEASITKVLDSDLQLLPDGTGWIETSVIETNNRIKWVRIENLHKWDNYSQEYALVNHKPSVANQLLIKLEHENDLGRILLDNKLHSAKRLTQSGWFRVELTNFKTVAALPTVLKNIRRDSEFAIIAEPDYLIRQANTVPNDPLYEQQWHLNANQGINAPAGWDIKKEAPDVIVAVIDSGIRATHEDLKNNLWVNSGEIFDGLDNDKNGFIDDIYGIDTIENSGNPADPSGHGTLVSGVIAADGNNSVGVAGATWNSRIMALRFMDENGLGTTADAIECLQYAVSKGAHIINMSWGGHGRSQALEDLLNECNDNGILCVASAGNSGVNIDANPTYPGAFALPNLITVAASDELLELANFSNWGPNKVHIAAPGRNIRTTTSEGDTTYGTFTGTSAAAPIVSGIAALAIAQFGEETPDRLKERLLQSSKLNNTLDASIVTGGNADLYRLLTEQNNRPSNDNFADALALTPFKNTVQSSLNFGSFELAEPNPQQVDNPKSLWFSFKAEHSSGAGIQVSARSFLPILNVYSGGVDIESLVLEGTSKRINTLADLRFATQAAQTYYLQLIGPSSAGSFDISLLVTPPNDDFHNATILRGDLFSAEGNNLNATSQIDEPQWDSRAKGQSLWWQYTPTRSGNFYLTTTGSETDTLLAVFKGPQLTKIHLLGSNDDQTPGFFTSGLSFDVSSGESYYFLVDSAYEPGGKILLSGQFQSTPRFITSPKDTTTSLGSEVTLSGLATGPKPLSYQWKKDSKNLPFANAPELKINPVVQANLGSYQLEVTSPGGSIISKAITLSLSGKPLRILLQPESIAIAPGETSVLRVLAEGNPPLSYQWFKDFTPITGATSNSLLVDSVTRGSGLYFVEIIDSNGSIRSAVAEVSVTDSMQPLGSVRSSVRVHDYIGALIYYKGVFIAGGADGRWQIMNPSGQWIPQRPIIGDSSLNAIVKFVEGNGLLIAIFQSGALAVTSDLENWTIVPAQQGGLGFISMVSKNGVFLRTDGADKVLRSVDGLNWEIVLDFSLGTGLPGLRLRDIAEANGYFAALEVSKEKLIFHRSSDGINWESSEGPGIPGSPYAYSLVGGPYFYVNPEQEHGRNGYYSSDGNLWTMNTEPPALISVTEAMTQFFATSREGNILRSNDGIQWTSVWSTGYRENPSVLSMAYGDGSFLVGPVDGTLFKFKTFDEIFLPDFRGGIGGDNIQYLDNQFVGVNNGWIHHSKSGASWENIPFENDFTGRNTQGIAFGNGIYTLGYASGATLDCADKFESENFNRYPEKKPGYQRKQFSHP